MNIKCEKIIVFLEKSTIKAVHIKCYMFEKTFFDHKDILHAMFQSKDKNKSLCIYFKNKEETIFSVDDVIENVHLKSVEEQIEEYLT